MRKDIDRALERLVKTAKNQIGVDLAGKIGISTFNLDGKGNRYRLEQVSDVNSDCIERHLSVNMTHGEMLYGLGMCQRLIEIVPDQ